MLVVCLGHARAICRISVAELRRVAPPAFYLLMVASLLFADGLLPVLAVKYRTEAALYSGGNTARSGGSSSSNSNSNSNTFIGGDWPATAHAMAAGNGNVRNLNNHKRTRVKTYGPSLAGNADVKSKHHYTVVSNGRDVNAPSPQSNVSSAAPTPVTSPRSKPHPSSPSSSPQTLVCSSNGTTDSLFHTLRKSSLVSGKATDETPPGKECKVLTNNSVSNFCAGQHQDMRLNFCSSYKVSAVYGKNSTENCTTDLLDIIEMDKRVEKQFEKFHDIIKRYDCRTNYSVKWDCYRCKLAYKDWLCSNNFPYFQSGHSWPPCSELCESVEERCPFFRPEVKTQAGDPSFICKDHHMNLPNTYQDKDCYRTCHLWSGDDNARKEYCHAKDQPGSYNCSLFDGQCSNLSDTFTTALLYSTSAADDDDNNNNNVTGRGPQNVTSHSGATATSSPTHSRSAVVDSLRVVLTLCLTLSQFRYLITELT